MSRTRHGNPETRCWKGKYGSEGAMVAGDRNTNESPKCVTVELRNCTVGKRWAATDKDPAHLQLTGAQAGRSALEWMAGDQIFIVLEVTDGKEHQVAVQIGCNRAMSVTVYDADTKVVLDTQNIPEKAGYRYLVWNLKGHVMIHALNLGSSEASPVCVGGVFVDPAGAVAK